MNTSILVTGGAGFIGFHYLKHLAQLGIPALGLDNFNDYYSPELKRARERELSKLGVSIIERDLCEGIGDLLQEHQISHVVHLAAQAGVRYSIDNPMAYLHSNLEGFLQVLEGCRAQPGVRLIYASSSSVYGLNTKIPFSETDPVDHPASLYGATKKSNEILAHSYHHLYKFPCIGLRFFTVYGPWGRPDMAYFKFAEKISRGESIDVYNFGDMRRDFTFVDDIVSGIHACLDLDCGYEVFNLGNHQPEPLLRMIELLEKKLGKTADKQFLPMQAGDVQETYADIEKSRKSLGFYPETSLEEGLELFVDWYKKYTALHKACPSKCETTV